jgi:hypothetical protein
MAMSTQTTEWIIYSRHARLRCTVKETWAAFSILSASTLLREWSFFPLPSHQNRPRKKVYLHLIFSNISGFHLLHEYWRIPLTCY